MEYCLRGRMKTSARTVAWYGPHESVFGTILRDVGRFGFRMPDWTVELVVSCFCFLFSIFYLSSQIFPLVVDT